MQFNCVDPLARILGIVCIMGTLANEWLIALARLLSVGKCPRVIKAAYCVFTYEGLRASCIYQTMDKQALDRRSRPSLRYATGEKSQRAVTRLLNQVPQV